MNTLKLQPKDSSYPNGYIRNGFELFTIDPITKTKAKMLIDDVPCDYQFGIVSGDWGSVSNVSFIKCNDKAIESRASLTEKISEVEIDADEFEHVIMNLMSNPPDKGVEFIRYERTKETEITLPDTRILFFRIKKHPKVSVKHYFSLLRTKVKIPK
jgi:hypothetical protein